MMDKVIEKLEEVINEIDIQEDERDRLFELVNQLKKEKIKGDFKTNRYIKDKSIAVNLLNATIEDLERKKEMIEENNKKLLEHQQVIEYKNNVLEERKNRIEDQRLQLAKNLEKLSLSYSELEQFTYIASHDLKSPLRTITNFGQLLIRRLGDKLDGENKEFLDFMIKGAKQMNTVICDLLEFAHVGNKNKVESKFDMMEVLDIVKFNLAEPIKENEALIICEKLPEIYGLRSSIIQLFQNLIGNAIKFRKENKAPIISITFEERGSEFYFEFADNGVGIEEEYQEKAFLPFKRINNLDRPGSGMGLAICKKVVKQHGGDIWFSSKRGKGTTFCFTLKQEYIKTVEKERDYIDQVNSVLNFDRKKNFP